MFGRIEIFFDIGMMIGAIASPLLYEIFRDVPIMTLLSHTIYGVIIPFAASALMGIVALAFILWFVISTKASDEP